MQSRNIPQLCLLLMMWLLISSCNNKEITRLQIENDSIRNALNLDHRVQTNLNDVRSLLDSIDRSRNVLVHHLDKGITLHEFSSRLADINHYIKKSEEKIQLMENALKSSKADGSAYFMLMLSLKDEMQRREDQISNLQAHIASYKIENDSVEERIRITETDTQNARQDLAAKQKELLFLQSKIQAIAEKLRHAQADAYYARARQVEEIARRTKLAPQKKRAAYAEALELYKIALSFGKDEARVDIGNLNKRLHH